jgi:PAS domain-containing protein
MSLSQLHLNYERILKLREEAQSILEMYPEKRIQAFTGSLEALLEELSVFQIELEMQNDELRELQSRLEQAQKSYRLFFQQSPVPVLSLNPQGHLIQANVRAIELLGIEKLATLPTERISISPMIHPEDLTPLFNHMKDTTASDFPQRAVLRLRKEPKVYQKTEFYSCSLHDESAKPGSLISVLIPLGED